MITLMQCQIGVCLAFSYFIGLVAYMAAKDFLDK
jgi:hypothetical protein